MRLAALLLLLATPLLATGAPLATVNDAPVSEADLEHYITRLALQQGVDPQAIRRSPQFPQVRAAVIDQLIQRELLWQAAQAEYRADDQGVQQAMQRTESEVGGAARLERALAYQGIDRAHLRRQLRQELSIQRYLDAEVYDGVAVAEQDVAQFYAANRTRFRSPDLLNLEVVRISGSDADSRARAEALRRRLRQGAPLDALAGEAEEASELGFVTAEDLGAELAAVAASLQAGEVSAPVAGPQSYYLLKLIERRPGVQAPLSAVSERIASELANQRRDQALATHLQALRAAARVQRTSQAEPAAN